MTTQYWTDGNVIHFSNENGSGTFTQEDQEGYYAAYLAWIAEGNTAEEWRPEP